MTFDQFAQSYGLMIPRLIADGRWHRVRTTDHPKKRNGAYKFDGAHGWVQNWAHHVNAIRYTPDGDVQAPDYQQIAEMRRKAQAERAEAEAKARSVAQGVMASVFYAPETRYGQKPCPAHPYMIAKGFPNERVPVDGHDVIVPMWDMSDYGKTLNGVQRIAPDGKKKFPYGTRAKGSIYRIGSGAEVYLCEGFATGLSIRDAIKSLYRQCTVVVCFSAGNLAHVARTIRGFVVADNDESGTGERVARETGHPWWMPPDVNTDANDFARAYGVRNLAVMLTKANR